MVNGEKGEDQPYALNQLIPAPPVHVLSIFAQPDLARPVDLVSMAAVLLCQMHVLWGHAFVWGGGMNPFQEV